jgi:hypothetical protein
MQNLSAYFSLSEYWVEKEMIWEQQRGIRKYHEKFD